MAVTWTLEDCVALVNACGERTNIVEITSCFTRLRIQVKNKSCVNEDVLQHLPGVKMVMNRSGNEVHLVIGIEVNKICRQCQAVLT
ncbi:MAG: PTS transporter subunit EIIB [Treponema sp.]|nr:PTS transporter subunit EIIB [Treponema sp.]